MNYSETQLRTNPRIVPPDLLLKFGYSPDNGVKFDSAASTLSFYQGGTKRADLTSFGLAVRDGEGLVVGHTAQITNVSIAEFQVLGTGDADTQVTIGRWSANGSGASLNFLKSRNATVGSNTIVQNGDTIMRLIATIDDGVNFNAQAAEIRFSVDGTPGADDAPGRITFHTSQDGTENQTEALRIDSSQDIKIGATNKLFFDGFGSGDTYIYEESADDLHIVVGGVILAGFDQDLNGGTGGIGLINTGGAQTIGLFINAAPHTAGADERFDIVHINGGGGAVTIPIGTAPTVNTLHLTEPNVTATGTVTRANTLYIASVATEATAGGNNAIYMPLGAFEVSDGQGASGEQLASGGADGNLSWTSAASVRSSKQGIVERTDTSDALRKMVDLSVYDFRYKNDPSRPNTGDYKTNYVGIIADEAPWAMHHNGSILNPINTFGYTVLAIKALESRIRHLESQQAVA